MLRFTLFSLLVLFGHHGLCSDGPALLQARLERLNLNDFTENHPTALALFDLNKDQPFTINPEACAQAYSPCSTFKIFNSLIGIETGIVKRDTLFTWDGSKQHFKSWERDHDLVSAFRNSVVWYYQHLARQIGAARMQAFLDAAQYGNRDIHSGIDQFWLDDCFRVSPNQQVDLLKRLYRDQLPFAPTTMKEVRSILVDVEDGPNTLSGKTGSAWHDGVYTHGWYVGHLKHSTGELVFAFHMEGVSGRDARATLIRVFQALQLMTPSAK